MTDYDEVKQRQEKEAESRSEKLLVKFSEIMTKEHNDIVAAVDSSKDLAALKAEMYSGFDNAASKREWLHTHAQEIRNETKRLSETQGWFMKIGGSVISAVGFILWIIYSDITEVRLQQRHDTAVLAEVSGDADSHREHPQLHTNGIAHLRDDINGRFVTNGKNDATIDQLNRRIAQLERQLQEITEGYIERANGKELPNTGHDQ